MTYIVLQKMSDEVFVMIGNGYLFFKFLHIIGIISWMAGILYFYRLFIYHFENGQKNEPIHSLLSLMEKRLFKFITVPAMVVSVLAGTVMVSMNPSLLSVRWFQIKVIAGFCMIITTLHGITLLDQFNNKKFQNYSSRGLRILNEIPTLLMILIVFLVIFRPSFN